MKSLDIAVRYGLIAGLFPLIPQSALAEQQPVTISQAPSDYTYERVLPLRRGQNFRELGGYPTEDGHHVRWGLLFRSGSMHGLEAQDFDYLKRLGIQTVVDFRSTQERQAEPANWPDGYSPRIVSDPYDFALLSKHIPDLHGMNPQSARAEIVAMYPLILKQFNSQYRRLFELLLWGKSPLVFHCSAGRDRTGVAAALVLTALGVPRETVIQDYLLTNRHFDRNLTGPAAQTWGNIAPEMQEVMESSARPSIEAVLEVIDRHPGGTQGYLRDELGLDDEKIALLRATYTD